MTTACGIRELGGRHSQRSSPRPTTSGSRSQQTMINFRVHDLHAMLAQLRLKGADVAQETQEMEGVGRFGWVTDPEGNRVELWQPRMTRFTRNDHFARLALKVHTDLRRR